MKKNLEQIYEELIEQGYTDRQVKDIILEGLANEASGTFDN